MVNMDNRPSIVNDIKASSKFIVGAIAFTTAVSTILIDVFQFDKQLTIGITIAITLLIVCSMIFISRVEHREEALLAEHIKEADYTVNRIENTLDELKCMTAEVRRDTLRIQLREYIKNEPDNVDTILTIAREYFVVYKGNWIAHNEFLNWSKEHNINIHPEIAEAIRNVDMHNS